MVHKIRIKVMCDAKALRSAMAAGLLAALSAPLGSENITLTTYYPAPVGTYQKMVTTRGTVLARDGDGVTIGSPTNPAATLSVAGGVQVGNDLLACTAAKAGTLKWGGSPASIQVCNGSAWGPLGASGFQVPDDASTCTAAKAGTLRWHTYPGSPPSLEVCNGSTWGATGAGTMPGEHAGSCTLPASGGCSMPVSPVTACTQPHTSTGLCTMGVVAGCAAGWSAGPDNYNYCVRTP